jgi:hypothetical protein
MSAAPTREEFDAKLAASEARNTLAATRVEAQLDLIAARIDGRFSNLESQLAETRVALTKLDERVSVESNLTRQGHSTTRTTIVVTGVASVLSLAALVYSLQGISQSQHANLLSAFQAGLTALTAVKPSVP